MDTKLTDKQRSFIRSLIQDREVPQPQLDTITKQLRISEDAEEIGIDKRMASQLIDALLTYPRKPKAPADRKPNDSGQELTPGVFEKDGTIYIVKPNQAKTRVYAKRLVEVPSNRLMENEDKVQIDFVYAPGAIALLTEADRMTLADAKQYTVRYGRCICCGRHLKVAESVERGIGPVCVTYFAR